MPEVPGLTSWAGGVGAVTLMEVTEGKKRYLKLVRAILGERCPVCARYYGVRQDTRIRKHMSQGARCVGSETRVKKLSK